MRRCKVEGCNDIVVDLRSHIRKHGLTWQDYMRLYGENPTYHSAQKKTHIIINGHQAYVRYMRRKGLAPNWCSMLYDTAGAAGLNKQHRIICVKPINGAMLKTVKLLEARGYNIEYDE